MLAWTCATGCERADAGASTTGASDDDDDDDTSTSSTGGTTFAAPSMCNASADCDAGVCAAPYDPGAGTGAAGMGTPVCVPSCVPEDSLTEWCIDDASCCPGLECSAIDGFCSSPAATSGESTIGETWVVDGSSEGGSTTTASSESGIATTLLD